MQVQCEPSRAASSRPEVQPNLGRLLQAGPGTPPFQPLNWSGREDSNLRPLPPEDMEYARIGIHAPPLPWERAVSVATPFHLCSRARFKANRGELSLRAVADHAIKNGPECRYQRHPALTDNRTGDATVAKLTPDMITPAVEARFWARVDRRGPDECWLWKAGTDRHGYGRMSVGGRARPAHRVAVTMTRGPVPDDRVCDHLCRVHGCVNPNHIDVVPQRENVIRGAAPALLKARNAAVTHCPQGHEYTEDNILFSKVKHRTCRICNKVRAKARRDRLRAGRAAERAGGE